MEEVTAETEEGGEGGVPKKCTAAGAVAVVMMGASHAVTEIRVPF